MTRRDLGHGVELVSRDEWALGRPVRGTDSRAVSAIDEFIVHHSGGVTLGDPDPLQWARNIYDYHVHTLGYAAEAYEGFVALHQGKTLVLEGRPIGCVSAATYMHNTRGYAVCYLRANGDGDLDSIVPAPVKTGFRVVAQVTAFTVGHTLVGTTHRRCKPDQTACPGNDLDGWVAGGGLWVPFDAAPGRPPAPPVPHPAPVPNPPAVWPPWPGVTLKRGSRGGLVSVWQSRMDTLGAKLGVTGIFDQATYDVTRFFQGTHGLVTDGEVGPLTWAAAR